MKKIIFFFFFFCWMQFSWSQKEERKPFFYSNSKLTQVLSDIEKAFAVKYSYVDSLVVSQRFSLPKSTYSLPEINAEIEKQSALQVVKINDRFYSLSQSNVTSEPKQFIALQEVIVEEFLAKGIRKTNEKFIISPQKVQTLPGVTDADILLSLQQLPGVKSPNETATGLYIRGGTADQNLILMDGIRLYHPGHLFGMISSINPNVEQTVNYYNKAVNPKFGERVSGVIDIQSTDKISEKTKINAGINALNADLYVQTPLFKEKLGLQLSGRKSYTEWLQTPTFSQLEEKVFQNTNFRKFDENNQFQFYDYSGKLNYKPNAKTEISFSGLMIKNDLDYKNVIANDSISNQKMGISNYGFGWHWKQQYSAKFSQSATNFYSFYSFDYLKKTDYETNKFEAFKKLNRVVDSGGELNYQYQINDQSNLEFGYQVLGNDISHLFNSYNQDIGVVLNLKHRYNITHAGFVSFKQEVADWSFQPGLRFNYYNDVRVSSAEPRVLVQKKFKESLVWQISYERRTQILSQVRENVANDLSLENYVWILSDNGDYPIQKANQFTSGFTFKNKEWLLDVDAYYKTITGITSFSLGFLSQNDNNIYQGEGNTKGLDVLLQRKATTWRAWLTYTFQDSQVEFNDLNASKSFAANADIKHSLNLSFSKKWNDFLVTAGWFWHTGKPFSSIDDSGQIISYNSERLPNYHRLDISGSYQFQNKKGNTFKVGLSVYNLYNRQALISKELERKYANLGDFSEPRYTVQNYYSLGILPNIFFRILF